MDDSKYTENSMRAEIHEVIAAMQARGEAVRMDAVALDVCRRHRAGLASGDAASQDDLAFFHYTSYTTARALATRCINARARAAGDQQPVIPGFEHLQVEYVITRHGVDVPVAIEDATDDELMERAALYEAQAAASLAHAVELRRYVTQRRAQREAGAR